MAPRSYIICSLHVSQPYPDHFPRPPWASCNVVEHTKLLPPQEEEKLKKARDHRRLLEWTQPNVWLFNNGVIDLLNTVEIFCLLLYSTMPKLAPFLLLSLTAFSHPHSCFI